MKQVLIKQGQIVVENVPAPMVQSGMLLVQVDHSCISAGTEMSGLQSQSQPLWKRALKNPKAVKSTLEMVAQQGLTHTRNVVEGKLSAGNPTGYSASGTVLQVGDQVHDIQPGDRVACAGAQCAHHAEIICVPRNLTAPVPDSLGLDIASTVTLGAIALQGVRRAQPTLGETFVVVGLGILGQITAQLLNANGCRVIGSDLDPSRIQLARELGMNYSIQLEDEKGIESIFRLTQGMGADGVILTAATPSDDLISQAFQMCRRKGRVVLVGDVGLNLKREDFYAKELDFFISTSYGPGRYDANYEEKGLDYPIGYVRWTENRNMEEYLKMAADGALKIGPLIDATYPVEEAPKAYASLKEESKPLIVLLSYPQQGSAQPVRTIQNPKADSVGSGKINLGIIGAGGFVKNMHVPNIQGLKDLFSIRAVASRTGSNSQNLASQVNAAYATTDYREILKDPEIDTVLISTRHNLHAKMTLETLQAGKHVLVEKPLALSQVELDSFIEFYNAKNDAPGNPVLLTGFNRRFSPLVRQIRDNLLNRSNPMILNYRMNAGYIPLDHWVHSDEGGGRNLGEACHIYDLFTYLTDSPVETIHACPIDPTTAHYSYRDNFVATMTFQDGSVATLTYTALGAKEHPKERLEVYAEGKVWSLVEYQKLEVSGLKGQNVDSKVVDKGHKQELEAFARSLRSGGEWPIPLWQQVQATEIALKVEEQLNNYSKTPRT